MLGFQTAQPLMVGFNNFSDQSVLSAFQLLIEDVDADRTYLLNLTPANTTKSQWGAVKWGSFRWGDVAQPIPVRFSHGLTFPSLAVDSIVRHWPVRTLEILQIRSTLSRSLVDLPGRANPTIGDIQLAIGDQDNDLLVQYNWDGREIEILMGDNTFTYSQYGTLFKGNAEQIEWNESTLTIKLQDRSANLDIPLHDTTYAGTGGKEGSDDIEGQVKPLAYGVVKNATPILIDRANLVYQFHDGQINAVDAVYDKAVALTKADSGSGGSGDFGDYDALVAATLGGGNDIESGEFATCLAEGMIRLGASPSGLVTGDIEGNASGGYVSTAADVIKRILTMRGGLSTSDIDLASFAAVNLNANYNVGYYSPSEENLLDVVDRLAASVGAFRTSTRENLVRLVIFDFTGPAGTIKEEHMIGQLQALEKPLPVWRLRLNHSRNWTIQTPDDVAAGATNDQKDFANQEFRTSEVSESEVRGRRLLAQDLEVNTFLASTSDADTEASRRLELFKEDRVLYKCQLRRKRFLFLLGDTVTLDFGRWGLSGGKNGIVVDIAENVLNETTDVTLWV